MGADLHGLCTQAVQASVERCNSNFGKQNDFKDFKVTMEDMIPCLKSVKPSAVKSILVDVPNVRRLGFSTQLKLIYVVGFCNRLDGPILEVKMN